MPEQPSLVEERLATLRADQQERWHQGERVLVERYLDEAGWLRDDAESLLDLLYAEILLREEYGERPRVEEYQRRFPQLAEPLRRQFALHDALGERSAAPAPGETIPLLKHARTPGDGPLTGSRPREIGPYDVLGELGRGGMGVVYKARHRQVSGRLAAVKVLRGDDVSHEERQRFRTEVEAAARLAHPNVVVIYEWHDSQDEAPYFAMECVEGGSLAEAIAGAPLASETAARLLIPVARAVQHAHERGVIHRDLKPGNVLLASPGRESGAFHPKVTDFGLARRLELDSGLTRTGAVLGTPSYMAPEQARGQKDVGPAADVYGLGAILYEMLTGRPPFKADSVLNTLQQVTTTEPVAPRQMQPYLPRDLEVICLKCLHKEPGRRYASAAALADDLERWTRGEAILARPPSLAERTARWVRHHPGWGALVTTTVIALLVLASVWWNFTRQLQAEKGAAENARDEATAEKQKAQRESERASALLQTTLQTLTQHVRVVSEGKERDIRLNNPGGVLFDLACDYADAAEAFRRDASLTPEQREQLAERTQAGAVDLLLKAEEVRFFDRPDNRRRLHGDKRLDPMRQRREFQSLLRRNGL